MKPVIYPLRNPVMLTRLSFLIFVMWKGEVDAAAVDVYIGSKYFAEKDPSLDYRTHLWFTRRTSPSCCTLCANRVDPDPMDSPKTVRQASMPSTARSPGRFASPLSVRSAPRSPVFRTPCNLPCRSTPNLRFKSSRPSDIQKVR